jgi:hypothetical protein
MIEKRPELPVIAVLDENVSIWESSEKMIDIRTYLYIIVPKVIESRELRTNCTTGQLHPYIEHSLHQK